PFRIINSEEFFSLEHKLPKTVRVRFEGSPEIIRGLAENPASHIAVEIDKVPRYGSMLTEKIPFSGVRDIGNLSGVRVVSIDPPHVRLAWDDEVMKDVSEIKIPLVGEPFGGAHTEVENLYGDIRLTGSKRMFERLNESGWVVSTESIDVSRRTMDFIETVKIDIPSDSGITRVEPTHFNVRVRFKTSNGSKSSVSGPDIPVEHAEELPEETTEPDPNTNAVSHFD
ncbi:MAG: hypothetical protein FWG05_04510, partial [Kiritimatiellaeota bacterium]|nr:hypothetical protein [Kiritimatiellota bacterium]